MLYRDGTAVRLGDEVCVQGWVFSRSGRVSCVPGLSAVRRDDEHHGLASVGIEQRDRIELRGSTPRRAGSISNVAFVKRG